MNTFIQDLENIYMNELIYRTLVVCNSGTENDVKTALETSGHSVIIADDLQKDYENMDVRIVIVSCDYFKALIDYFDVRYGLQNVSYNFVAFTYDIDNDVRYVLKTWFNQVKKNDAIII